MEQIYYVVETERMQGAYRYVENGNNTYVIITTTQPTTNLGHEIIENGWLGTTNDVWEYLHGAFDYLEEAQAFVKSQGEFCFFTIDEDFSQEDGNLVYRDQREWWDVDDWFQYTKDELGITAETTDDELQDIAIVLEKEIDVDNIQIVGDIELYLEHLRETLKI